VTGGTSPARETRKIVFPEGRPSIGVGVSELLSPSLLSILAAGGIDYGFVDMEHTSFSFRDVSLLLAGARAVNLPVLVRPPEVSRSAIGRLLDLGADGIIAQRIGSAEDAAAAVRYSRYRPLGDRSDSGRIAAAFERQDVRALIDAANENTIVIAILETREGVESIDEICTTPGIDGIWVGPADLSLALDVPGDLGSLVYAEAEDRIVGACRAHGMPFAIGSAGTPSAAQAQIRRGCFTLLADDEVTLLGRAVADYVSEVRGTLGIGAGGN